MADMERALRPREPVAPGRGDHPTAASYVREHGCGEPLGQGGSAYPLFLRLQHAPRHAHPNPNASLLIRR